MEKITDKELDIIRKYYRIYLDEIPENKKEIWDFLDSLSSYKKQKHYNDEDLTLTVSQIVNQYFQKKGKTIYPVGKKGESFTITDDGIKKRKEHIIEWIKSVRDNKKCNGYTYQHYDGGSCATSEELHDFYCYIFDHYYESIGASWEYC